MTLPVHIYTSIFGDRVQTQKRKIPVEAELLRTISEVICPYQMGTHVCDLNSHRAELAHSMTWDSPSEDSRFGTYDDNYTIFIMYFSAHQH